MPPASREKSSDPRNKYLDNSNPPSPKSAPLPPTAFNSSNGLSGNGSVGELSPDCISIASAAAGPPPHCGQIRSENVWRIVLVVTVCCVCVILLGVGFTLIVGVDFFFVIRR